MPLLNLATPEFFYFPQKNFQQMSGFFLFFATNTWGERRKSFRGSSKVGSRIETEWAGSMASPDDPEQFPSSAS
jgi:hypothetical protein